MKSEPCRQLKELSVSERDVENRFTFHPPTEEQRERYQTIRDNAKALGLHLAKVCPQSRELSTALTKLDEVVFFANAAIARNP